MYSCPCCDKEYKSKRMYDRHINDKHPNQLRVVVTYDYYLKGWSWTRKIECDPKLTEQEVIEIHKNVIYRPKNEEVLSQMTWMK